MAKWIHDLDQLLIQVIGQRNSVTVLIGNANYLADLVAGGFPNSSQGIDDFCDVPLRIVAKPGRLSSGIYPLYDLPKLVVPVASNVPNGICDTDYIPARVILKRCRQSSWIAAAPVFWTVE